MDQTLERSITESRCFRLWAIAISIALTILLLLGSATSKYVAVFRFYLHSSADLALAQDIYVVETSGTPTFNLRMKSSNPNNSGLYLWLQPQEERTTYPQGPATILNDDVSWPVSFGSRFWPVKQDEAYSFKVTDKGGQNVLALGDVDARVHAVGIGWLWTGSFISTLASVLQIIAFLGQRDR